MREILPPTGHARQRLRGRIPWLLVRVRTNSLHEQAGGARARRRLKIGGQVGGGAKLIGG